MTPLVLDLSPMLVNRTAMFDVCQETAAALKAETSAYQYYGQIFDAPPDAHAADALKSQLGDWLAFAPRGRAALLARAGSHTYRATAMRKVFLDPLYTLFSDLDADDVVLILDMSTVTHPWWHDPAVAALYDAAFDRLASLQPRLLAISANTADTFAANYGYPRRPIDVVPLYVPEHLNRRAGRQAQPFNTGPYFLFVGSLEARKNVQGAIAAFAQSGLAERGYSLLIAGGAAHGALEIEAFARQTPGVVLSGFVDNDELSALYAGAQGFVYPSYLEGFGVPLLEAMRHGVPAVASSTGACPEVGGALVAYCDPDDHAKLADELLSIADMSPAMRADWARTAKQWVDDHFSLSAFHRNIARAVLTP